MALSEKQASSLIERYSAMVYRLAYSWTQNPTDADDITQEVFLRYIRRAPIFTSQEHEKAWLLRVTLNCAKSYSSSKWRTYEPVEEVGIQPDLPDESVLKAVMQLKPKERACVHLFYYEDLSIDQIAQHLKMNASTVKSHLHRARATLKDLLKEDYDGL